MEREVMLRASFMLATIPALVFAIAGSSTSPPIKPQPPPLKPHAVQTEGVRAARQDDETFRRRWAPLYDVPPAIEVRYSHDVSRDVNVSRGTERHADAADTAARSAP